MRVFPQGAAYHRSALVPALIAADMRFHRPCAQRHDPAKLATPGPLPVAES